jgi:hypothetical protein
VGSGFKVKDDRQRGELLTFAKKTVRKKIMTFRTHFDLFLFVTPLAASIAAAV